MSTYTATTVPTQFVEADSIRFAYRRWGKQSGLPLVFNQHFTGNLDNWDPAVLDGLAKSGNMTSELPVIHHEIAMWIEGSLPLSLHFLTMNWTTIRPFQDGVERGA